MPNLTASVTSSSNVGVVSYGWTINQTGGVAFAGVTTTTNTPNATVTYPTTLTWSGAGATSGTYAYTLQCTATDSGIGGCTQIKTFVLYFTNTPLACTLTLSNISVV